MAAYLREILEALHYLHNCRIAHLDLKVGGSRCLCGITLGGSPCVFQASDWILLWPPWADKHVDVVLFCPSRKPENMLVDQSGGQPVVKLADFGDAVRLGSTRYVHPLLGSPEFAAPELVLGEPAALASDVWSVGVLTYVLLSGASPFLDESAEETCLNICRLDFSFPDDYFQGVSQGARDFVRLLLRSEPPRRPPTSLCLQEPWLQPGHGAGSPHIDTSRLISFIDRRKHQNDVRPVGSIKAFLHSRLLPAV